MNARRKLKLRTRQAWRRALAVRNANHGPAVITPCQRCQRPFMPEWNDRLGFFSRCCKTCSVRNFFDGLELPTPPELLDRHTVHPTLTDEEWRRKL